MEAPLKKTAVHLAVVCIILLQLLAVGQCSSHNLDKSQEPQADHQQNQHEHDEHVGQDSSEKNLAKRSVLHHSYQSGLVSDYAYSLPAGIGVPQYVKQLVPAAVPAVPVVKTLAFPAYQQRIVPGNAFVTSHSVTYPRYPVIQRPIVYAAPAPAPVAPVAVRPFVQFAPAPLPAAPVAPVPVRPFLQFAPAPLPAPLPPPLPAPLPAPFPASFAASFPVPAPAPLPAPQPLPLPAPTFFQSAPVLPAPPPPPVRPFVIVARPLPPPPAPLLPAATPVFAVAAPVPCHHQANMPPNQVSSPSEPENFGFMPAHPQKPWQHGGGSGSGYLPPSPAHLTYKSSQPSLRLSIHNKYRPRWK